MLALLVFALLGTAYATGGVCDPASGNAPPYCTYELDCPDGSFVWAQNINANNGGSDVRLKRGSSTNRYLIPPVMYPSEFALPVKINITEAIAYDGYNNRDTVSQPNERYRLTFYLDGQHVWSSDYTDDLADNQRKANWRGPLGMMMFPNGFDEVKFEHWSVASMPNSNADSVVPAALCMSVTLLDPDECMDDNDCIDSDACTVGACTDNVCVYANVTAESDTLCFGEDSVGDDCLGSCDGAGQCECRGCDNDLDCHDDNLCTENSCIDSMCMLTNTSSTPPGTACVGGTGDGDGSSCLGVCDGSGNCECPECYTDVECDDDNDCTADNCVEGVCQYDNVAEDPENTCFGTDPACLGLCDGSGACICNECDTDLECNDENPCTTDTCVENECVYQNVTVEAEAACVGDDEGAPCLGQCDGGGECTCAVGECDSALDCVDDNTCTFDVCNNDGACEFLTLPINSPCEGEGECAGVCNGSGECTCVVDVPVCCLGSAGLFGVLGGSAVTNTGTTTIEGHVGSSPTPAVTGFYPPGTATGTVFTAGHATVDGAKADAQSAFDCFNSMPCDFDLTNDDLGTAGPLEPGVYCYSSSAQLTGTLILDGQNASAPRWIFQIGSTLTTASSAQVQLTNVAGGTPAVTWLVGSSATFGTSTAFQGRVIASDSISMTTSATNQGNLIALTGAVTLDTNDVDLGSCDGVGGCPDCDDDNACTVDVCDDGICSNVPGNVGDECTGLDDCDGTCAAGGVCVCDPECDTAEDCMPTGETGCDYVCLAGGECARIPNNSLCEDGNECTVDLCTAQGTCSNTPVGPNTECVNEEEDSCQGTCQGTECVCPVECVEDQDCRPEDASDNACDYQCVNNVCLDIDNNELCDDDNSCTLDLCIAGICSNQGESNEEDACLGENNCVGECRDGECFCPTTTCPPSGSLCYTLVPNEAMDDCIRVNTTCNDMNECTNDSCNDQTGCVFTPREDISDNNACTLDVCVPNLGLQHIDRTCIADNKCVMSMCNPETGDCDTQEIVCDDNNPCTLDTCDPLVGCRSMSITGCVACTQDQQCDDSNVCTTEFCNESNNTCTYQFDEGVVCEEEDDDEDLCTRNVCHPTHGCVPVNKQCPATLSALFYAHSGSGSVAELLELDNPPPCTVGVCDPETGDCSLEPIDCTATGDQCTIGFCDPTINQCVRVPRLCPVSNECNEGYCSSANGCQERPRVIEDPNACLRASCVPGDGIVFEDRDCDDGLACTIDSCNPATGCIHAPINCTDADPCTINERCFEGQCVSDQLECEQPLNLCLEAQCVPGQGCQVSDIECPPPANLTFEAVCNPATGDCINVIRDCDDQDPCTLDTIRTDGSCLHTAIPGCCRDNDDCPLSTQCAVFSCDLQTNTCVESSNQNCCANDEDCDDGLNCTIDTCQAATGTCFYQPVQCLDPLDDLCTDNTCSEETGQCESAVRTCDDGDACTLDRCVPSTGECVNEVRVFCDDGNACTIHVCDSDSGTCLWRPKICRDGNLCTVDTCDPLTGECVFTPVDVDDQNVCTTDRCIVEDGQGVVIHQPISCDDDNGCTVDLCNPLSGCEHVPVDCSELEGVCLSAECNRVTGQCEVEQIPNCCQSNIECTQRGERCTEEYCDYNTNRCVFAPRPNCCDADKDCDDRNKCTIDMCDVESGTCCHEPVICEAPDACSVARCVPDRGCVIEPRDCSDENACTVDTCELVGQGEIAQCVHTPMECEQTEDPCDTEQVCVAGACVDSARDGPCDDGDPCTIDHCSDREFKFQTPGLVQCTYDPVDCRDTNPCTRDFCDSTTGKCVHVRNPFQECCLTDDDCDDLNRCTREHCDTLTNQCVRAPVEDCCLSDYDCQDDNACTHSERCDTIDNICIYERKTCCDFNDCTEDTCDTQTGECTHRSIVDSCNDFDICTIDFCDPDGGCRHEPRVCGQPDNQCLISTCSSVSGCVDVARDCDDGDACTIDTCDPQQGCVHTPRDCDDGLACTVDSCSASNGRCQHRPVECNDDDDDPCTAHSCSEANDGACVTRQVICNDGNACTTDVCEPGVGCVHREISCDDGNACTWDTCEAGKFGGCRHTHKRHCCQLDGDCDDNDDCTEDTCQAGLCHFARLHTPECCEPSEAPAPPPNAALFAHAAPAVRERDVVDKKQRANHNDDGCGNGVVEEGEECDGDADDGFFTRCNDQCEFHTYFFAVVIVVLAALCVLIGLALCAWALFAGGGGARRARRSRRAMRD